MESNLNTIKESFKEDVQPITPKSEPIKMDAVFDIEKIKSILPHRYPFLLVDRVIEFTEGGKFPSKVGNKIKAIKNVTANEEFFNGHFPHRPIMPGVLIIEAMAQTAALAYHREGQEPREFMIGAISDFKIRRPVVPGDQIIMIGEVLKDKGRMSKVKMRSEVGGQLVTEFEILAVIQSLPTNPDK